MNKTNSLSTFVWHAMGEVLELASVDPDRAEPGQQVSTVGPERERELVAMARSRKKGFLSFFNSPEGVELRSVCSQTHLWYGHQVSLCFGVCRLSVRDHFIKSFPSTQKLPYRYCILCRDTRAGSHGHKISNGICRQCGVSLCQVLRPGQRKTCWQLWHSSVSLARRVSPNSTPPSSRDSTPSRRGSVRRHRPESTPPLRPNRRHRLA